MSQSSGPDMITSSVYRTRTSVSEYVRWNVMTENAKSARLFAGVSVSAYGSPSALEIAANAIVSMTVTE